MATAATRATTNIQEHVGLMNQIARYCYIPARTTLISMVTGYCVGNMTKKPQSLFNQAVISNIWANAIFPVAMGLFLRNSHLTSEAKYLCLMLNSVSSIAISYIFHKKILAPNIPNIKKEEQKSPLTIPQATSIFLANQAVLLLVDGAVYIANDFYKTFVK